MFVDDRLIRVEGIYVLRNHSTQPRIQSLFYPFPVDSLHPYPDSIVVEQKRQAVPFRQTDTGVSFAVEVPAEDIAGFRVTYLQSCLDNTGCYILTTTAKWERPLESAEFVITLGIGVVLDWSAYELSTAEGKRDTQTYRFERNDFMPDKDLCMRWRMSGRKKDTPE